MYDFYIFEQVGVFLPDMCLITKIFRHFPTVVRRMRIVGKRLMVMTSEKESTTFCPRYISKDADCNNIINFEKQHIAYLARCNGGQEAIEFRRWVKILLAQS